MVKVDFLQKEVLGPYYKSKLEMKSNSSKILSVNCWFICDSTPTKTMNSNLRSLMQLSAQKDMNTYKLAIKWQNFARVRLQLKFAFNKLQR